MKTFGKVPSSKEREALKKSPYYRKKGFVFMGTKPNASIGFQIAREYAYSSKKERAPQIEIPVFFYTQQDFTDQPSQSLKMMWLGHAGLLIELAGKRLLVDPVFSQRPSPTQLAGPNKRFHPPPFSLQNLPVIDYVLITHNHYDHLDYDFISSVKQQKIQYIVPLGLGATLKFWDIAEKCITEIDWHQSIELDGLDCTAADAKHYSGRGLRDRNASFWSSYILSSNKNAQNSQQKIFISGDSGYVNTYKTIGKKYGPFDIAAIAIGAYHRLWPDNHKTPEEAWQAKNDLRANKMLPLHWATFDLALHSWDEPVERLLKAAKMQKNELILPKVGEWIDFKKELPFTYWWRSYYNNYLNLVNH